jgi:hypothetical protein
MRLTKTIVASVALAAGLALALPASAQSRGGGHAAGGGRTATSAPRGTAVARPGPVYGGAGHAVVAGPYHGGYYYRPPYYYRPYYYRPYYYPYHGYYCCPYGYGGFGLSFGFSFGYPYYGYPYPYAYAYPYPYYGAPAPYPYPGAYGAVGVQTYGSVRIDLPQRDAEVYIDGNFAGTVDQNNGTFNLDAGSHHIEVRAQGFAATSFDVSVTPGRTTTYRTALRPQ